MDIRPMIICVKKKNNKKNLVGVEIGVKFGEHAKNILKYLPMKKIYLIDPWQDSSQRGLVYKAIYKENNYNKAKKNLVKFKKMTEFVRKNSEDAVDDIPDKLDFVYIDGNHTYIFVKRDLELYYSKVKEGGVIGGHDTWSPNVFIGILGFILKKRLLLKLNMEDPDWWIVKDKKEIKKAKNDTRYSLVVNSIECYYDLLKYIFVWINISIKRIPTELGIKKFFRKIQNINNFSLKSPHRL